MAVTTTHGVTAQEVVDDLPFDTTYVDQSRSRPLNLDLVEKWIERGAGVLNALLSSRGIDPSTLTGDSAELVRMGVFAYATYRALSKLGADDREVRDAYAEWKEVRNVVRTMPEEMGDAAPTLVYSNIDPDSPTEKTFGEDFGGW